MLEIKELIKTTADIKLLYVEDNYEARLSTLDILKEFFDDIQVACDGAEGLEIFNNYEINLIFTDINMPKLNGLNMIKEIRKTDIEVPILILSAYNEPNFFIDSIKLGVEGYLLKPIDIDQFLITINKVTKKILLKKTAEENAHLLKQYQDITDKNSIVSKINSEGRLTYVNDQFCNIFQYSRDELIDKHYNITMHPDMELSIYKDIVKTLNQKKETWSGTLRNLDKFGGGYYVKATIKPILNKEEEIIEYIALYNDITEIMSPKKQLQDLINSYDETIVLLFQIENFEDIEKFYGAKHSQEIEHKFSEIIMQIKPQSCVFDKMFILGDGKYAFAKDREHCKVKNDDIIDNLKNFQQTINEAYVNIGALDYNISIIISIAFGHNALSNATYGLKEILKVNQDFIVANNLVQKEFEEAQKNLKVLKMIRVALNNSKITSYFQPIINNKTKKIQKYESLVRLIDEDDNILSPHFFLDVAKKGKYYAQITHTVIENSFLALDIVDVDISINVSALDIERQQTRNKILEMLEKNKNNLHRVIFELLEDEEVKDFKLIKSFITQVKAMGVRIAIDDFGVGYSNFERLLNYQPDILKIDGSLIKNIEHDKFSLDVVETIVSFAKKQNIQTIAEYVENEEIFNIITKLGVDYSQGYFFGKPESLTK